MLLTIKDQKDKMPLMLVRLILVIFALLISSPITFADQVILKSGEVIEGTIVKETPVFVRIHAEGQVEIQEFLTDLVDQVIYGEVDEVVPKESFPSIEPPTPTEEQVEHIKPIMQVIGEFPEEANTQDQKEVVSPQTTSPATTVKPKMQSIGVIDATSNTFTSAEQILEQSEPKKIEGSSDSKSFKPLLELDNDTIRELLPWTVPEEPEEVEEEPGLFQSKLNYILIVLVVIVILVLFLISKRKKVRQNSTNFGETSQNSSDVDDISKDQTSLEAPPSVIPPSDLKKSEGLSAREPGPKAMTSRVHEGNYWQQVPLIFAYPLRGPILSATVGATIFFAIMNVAMFAPFYGIVVTLMFLCYTIACMVSIIETAATTDREDLFDWPDFQDWFDWIGKGILFMLAWVISYAPAILYFVKLKSVDPILFILIAIGMYIAPMYTMAISLVGGLGSLNVINVFKAIGATFLPYTLTVICLGILQLISLMANFIPLMSIPIWGGLVKWFVFVYFLFVNMRLLGTFYKAHRLRLRWYGEDE